jgi:hypothetical protein
MQCAIVLRRYALSLDGRRRFRYNRSMSTDERLVELARRLVDLHTEEARIKAEMRNLLGGTESGESETTAEKSRIQQGSIADEIKHLLDATSQRRFRGAEIVKALPHRDAASVRGALARLYANGAISRPRRGYYQAKPALKAVG